MTSTNERTETFEVEDDHLIRRVVPRRGEPYENRCPRASFEQVAHAIDEAGNESFTLELLVEREDLPFTQVAVALAFFKERGIVQTRDPAQLRRDRRRRSRRDDRVLRFGREGLTASRPLPRRLGNRRGVAPV